MYWKIKQEIIDNVPSITYAYLEIKDIKNCANPYFNSITKTITYPQKYELVIEYKTVKSESEFEVWYFFNSNL